MADILQMISLHYFLYKNGLLFFKIAMKFVSKGAINKKKQHVSLVMNRKQAIISINDDLI